MKVPNQPHIVGLMVTLKTTDFEQLSGWGL